MKTTCQVEGWDERGSFQDSVNTCTRICLLVKSFQKTPTKRARNSPKERNAWFLQRIVLRGSFILIEVLLEAGENLTNFLRSSQVSQGISDGIVIPEPQ